MISKRSLKNIICISILFSGLCNAQIIFIPFENNSSYDGTWKLEEEVPNYIAAYFREFHNTAVLSSTAFVSLAGVEPGSLHLDDMEFISKVAVEHGFDYAVIGKIKNFNIARFTAGDPLTAGYEAYNCEIEAGIRIYDLRSNTMAFSENIKEEFSSGSLGLNLLGKPSDEKRQFFALNEIRFGSEEFSKTIVGEAMIRFCENLSGSIIKNSKSILQKKDKTVIKTEIPDKSLNDISLNTEIKKGEIITYDKETGEAFINLGSSSNISVGEELSVYTKADSLFDPKTNKFLGISDKKISVLEIIEIRGESLSLAVVKENKDEVEAGMEIRKLVIKRRE